MAYGLSERVIDQLQAVFQKSSKIEKVILYGSRAKGNYKAGSDIDLTVISESLTLTELLAIENAIDDLLLPYKVDLSLYSKIDNEELKEHIHRVGVEFYTKP